MNGSYDWFVSHSGYLDKVPSFWCYIPGGTENLTAKCDIVLPVWLLMLGCTTNDVSTQVNNSPRLKAPSTLWSSNVSLEKSKSLSSLNWSPFFGPEFWCISMTEMAQCQDVRVYTNTWVFALQSDMYLQFPSLGTCPQCPDQISPRMLG